MQGELKVKTGDKVLYKYWTFAGAVERIETVTRVTPTGRIRVEGSDSYFNKYGREMGDSYYKAQLSVLTDADEKRIKENSVIEKAVSLMGDFDSKTLTYDKAVKIVEILGTE